MASLAESSVGSVPMPTVDALRRQMLMHAQADLVAPGHISAEDRAKHHRGRDASSELPAHVEVPASGNSVVPQSQNAAPTPKASPLRRRPQYLLPSASAPAQEMEGMLDVTPSQNAFRMLTKAASFHAYPDGDTQPMESQVYRDYHESMAQQTKGNNPERARDIVNQSPNTHSILSINRTMRTCEEGDTGYIDLEGAFQPVSPSSVGGFDELLASPQTQVPNNINAPQHGAFAMPETPALAGRKHGRDGEPVTSATNTTAKKTPAYSQLFGMATTGPVLSATQLFNQTQARSSPVPDQLRSDPVVTRPSPNINGQTVVSSPPDAFSSPILAAESPVPGGYDPRGTYTSMRESQERRAARLRQELGRQVQGDEDFWNDGNGDDTTQSQWPQRRMRRVMSDHAISGARKPRASMRSSSRPSSANNLPSTVTIMETPAVAHRGERLEFDDGFLEEADSDAGEVDGEEADVEEPNDNDEYDELAQVLRSQANDEDVTEHANAGVHDQLVPHEHEPVDETSHRKETDGQHDSHRPPTQQSAIADSQPGTQEKPKYTIIHHGGHQSSSASFIPGSQYTGRTSEDQARLAASQYGRLSQRIAQDKIPSSPPLPLDIASSKLDDPEMSELHAPHAQPPSNSAHTTEDTANAEPEVPESDLPDAPHSRPYASASQGQSNSLPFFSTAQTHASGHLVSKANHEIASPLKMFASQHSRVSEFSPRKAAGVRHFSEFASVTPPDGSGQTQADVDAIVNDVMTAEDREYMAAIANSPRTKYPKRRKLIHHSSENEISPSNDVEGDVGNGQNGIIGKEPSAANPMNSNTNSRPSASISPRGLHANTSNENDSPPASRALSEVSDSTPNSVRTREKAGAQAVSQLLSRRVTKASKKSKVMTKSKTVPTSTKAMLHVSRNRPVNDLEREPAGNDEPEDHGNAREPEQSGIPDETATAINGHPQVEPLDTTARVSHPERTFALFKGQYNQYFPATWVSSCSKKWTHRVQFDDRTTTDIETHHVCALDLRIGDTIKVDRASMRKESWIIVGFGSATTATDDRTTGVDIYGRSRVLVQAKSARNSAGGGNTTTLLEGVDTHEIPITNVYITQTMWKYFCGRAFNPPSASKILGERAGTPLNLPRTPDLDTPASRTRRSVQAKAQEIDATHTSLRHSLPTLTAPAAQNVMFKGMAFAVSYTPKSEHKRASTTALIRQNGGHVFESSFLELFDVPGLDTKKETPKKASITNKQDRDLLTYQIKPEFTDLGFVALISDQHHRKAKYIQALALGLPTLSARWVNDCLDVTKNPSITTTKAAPLGWGKYLLPAGESSYLDGAIRSRTLSVEDITWAKLPAAISARPRLLNDEGVLIFPGKSKNTRENRDMFAFLTLALGARRVRRVANLAETKALLEREAGDWKWVYVDGEIAEAAAELLGDTSQAHVAGGKKRKRGQEPAKVPARMFATNGQVTVVNDEFVIQSLILGALIE